MIPLNQIINQIRIEEKDINEVKFSDWDIINAINKALRLIANQFSMRNTDFFERSVEYTKEEAEAGAELPRDYIVVSEVVRADGYRLSPSTVVRSGKNYRISNGKLYADCDILMKYKGAIDEVFEGGSIDLPFPFFDLISMSARLVLKNEPEDVLYNAVARMADNMIPRRKYTNTKITMPFDC